MTLAAFPSSPRKEAPTHGLNMMQQLLTAVGELYVAMGRPPFTAQEPVDGIIETLNEAARRLQATPDVQELQNRILHLEMEKQAMLNGLKNRDDQVERLRKGLASLTESLKLPGAQTDLRVVPMRPPEDALERARKASQGKQNFDVERVWEIIWLACPKLDIQAPLPEGYKLLPRRPEPAAMVQAKAAYRNTSVYDVADIWHNVWRDSRCASNS